MTPKQAQAIREAAEVTYRELFGPASAEQLARVREVTGPAWRALRQRRAARAQAGPARPEAPEAA